MDCLEGECVVYFVYGSASQCASLSPMGWPRIYNRCPTSWIVTRSCSHWMGFYDQYRIW